MVSTQPPAVRMPGKAGFWVGSILLIIGVVGGLALVAVGALALVRGLIDVPAVNLGEERTLQLESQVYELYLYNQTGGSLPASDPDVTIESSGGEDVPLGRPTPGTQDSGTGFRSIGTFTINRAGSYTIAVERLSGVAAGTDVRVGDDFESLVTDAAPWLVVGMVVGFIGFTAGLVLLIMTAVRRNRARRAQRDAWIGYSMTQPGYPTMTSGAPGGPQAPSPGAAPPTWPSGPPTSPPREEPPSTSAPEAPSRPPAIPGPDTGTWGAPPSSGLPGREDDDEGPRDPFG